MTEKEINRGRWELSIEQIKLENLNCLGLKGATKISNNSEMVAAQLYRLVCRPTNQEVVGSNPAGSWAFFFYFPFWLSLIPTQSVLKEVYLYGMARKLHLNFPASRSRFESADRR